MVRASGGRQAASGIDRRQNLPVMPWSSGSESSRQVEVNQSTFMSMKKKQQDDRLSVRGTVSNILGAHVVEDKLLAVLNRTATAFVRRLAQCIGMSESSVLDIIVETYRKTHGLNPPF
jgi:hypothetical protein